MKRIISVLMFAVLVMSLLSGCYINKQVEASQVGLELPDGVTVRQVYGSGRYTKMSFYSELVIVDVSAKTSQWIDPSLVTRDKQPIGLDIVLTYQRMRNGESISEMWRTYRSEVTDDAALEKQVLSRLPGIAKDVTTNYSLDQMLGVSEGDDIGRQQFTNRIAEGLAPELEEVYVELLDVRIVDIAVDDDYLKLLAAKANAVVSREVAQEQTLTLKETLKQEQAQTDIDLELARRQNLVNQELAKVYESSPEFMRLKILETLRGMFSGSDKIVFIPPDSDLSIIIGAEGIVPVD